MGAFLGRIRLKGLFALGGAALAFGSTVPSVDLASTPVGARVSVLALRGTAVETQAVGAPERVVRASPASSRRVAGGVEHLAVPTPSPTPKPSPSTSVVSAAPAPPGVPTGAAVKQVIDGSATAYCLTGRTATGGQAGPGSIAVDPAVIPLGSHLYVTGYGYGWAVDTGSAIKGTLIDVWYPCDQASQWGRRSVTIYILAS